MPAAHEADQFRRLTRLFTARFYDNDLLGPDVDLRRSFIWLAAGLMTPSLFLSVKVLDKYSSLALALGPEAVAVNAVFEKTLLVGFAMVAMGVLTVIAWDALLLDRRDVLILGALPLRWRTILAAKGCTLVLFWLVTTLGINGISAVVFPVTVGGYIGLIRHLVTHLVIACAASACVFSWLVLLQVLAVSALGPRASRWLAVGVQLLVGVLLLSVLMLLPALASAVLGTVKAGGPAPAWWNWMPPIWFVAAYERMVGHEWEALSGFAARAWAVTGLGPAAAGLATVASYRRHMRRQVSGTPASIVRMGSAIARLTRIAPAGPPRALMLFTLATLWRSGHHRVVVGLAGGVALALGLVGVLDLVAEPAQAWTPPPVSLLSLALVTLFVLSAAVATLFGTPAELSSRWVFAAGEPRGRGRALDGVRRALWIVALGPAAAIAGATGLGLGSGALAVQHTAWCVGLGVLVGEIWMREVSTVPFTVARDPGTARMHRVWPVYVAGLLTIGYTSAGIEQRLLGNRTAFATTVGGFVAIALALRFWHRRRPPSAPFVGTEREVALQTLGLSGGLPMPTSTSEAG